MITQAQIEAAAKAIEGVTGPSEYIARLALTAAAEADDTEWTCADCGHRQRGHRFKCEKCGFYIGRVDAAAAEVGEQDWCEQGKGKIIPADTVRAAIIERCAQVAEKYAKKHFATSPEGLASAIRAMKEEE